MGRYYNGDIEGKFMFAVQSSNDADFFGVQGQEAYLHYYFDKDNSSKIQEYSSYYKYVDKNRFLERFYND